MQVPAAEYIESAADSYDKLPQWVQMDQQRELESFGDARAQHFGATGLSDDFRLGYSLGLQVARVLQAMTPGAKEVL